MSLLRSRTHCRIVHASIPSAILTAKLCLALEPRTDLLDILVLTSDNYTGNNPSEYEETLKTLASGHPWAALRFWNGNRESLEYTGRILPPKSKWERIHNWFRDAALFRVWMRQLIAEVQRSGTEVGSEGRCLCIDEIWVDIPTAPSRFLLNSYPRATKVLFPHAVQWENTIPPSGWFGIPGPRRQPDWSHCKASVKRAVAKRSPLAISSRLQWGVPLDRAYMMLDIPSPSPNVIEVSEFVTKSSVNMLCSALRSDMQDYFRSIGAPAADGRPALLILLPAHERSQHFEPEVTLLVQTFRSVGKIHSCGPIILKPHPRGSDRYVTRLRSILESAGHECRVLDRWGSIPVELVAGLWDIAACVGLFTSALLTLHRIHNIPAYCPIAKALDIYADDQHLRGCADAFLSTARKYLIAI